MPRITQGTSTNFLDGTIITATEKQTTDMIYSDYTNMDVKIIENHDMDLSLFYEKFQKPETIIDEIPIDRLNILINRVEVIIENTKQEQPYTFDTYIGEEFISGAIKK